MNARGLVSTVLCFAGAAECPISASAAPPAGPFGTLQIPGHATDLSGAAFNRFGAFGSAMTFDRANNVYYAITDRGSAQGLLDFPARMHKFTLDVHPLTGAPSNFRLLETIMLTSTDGTPLNGKAPSPGTLGAAFDPEGLALAPNGHFYAADEYGPSIYEFQLVPGVGGKTEARMVRSLAVPANLLPRDAAGNPRYAGATVTGRQDNRGYEGLTLSPDGSKLYAILQGPLTEEGDHPTTALPLGNGRYSRNVRIAEFDTATGQNTSQYIYQLESLSDINARLPSASSFAANVQGRSIGVSEILAVGDGTLLVFERDDRGIGDEDPLGIRPVSTKRLYQIDLSSASDVRNVSLAGTVDLPPSVQPVAKKLLLDVQAALSGAGVPVVEKYESLVLGPTLADGSYALLIGSDNDMSMTRDSTGAILLDVFVNDAQTEARYTRLGDPSRSYASIDLTSAELGPLPAQFSPLPSYIVVVPEPAGLGLLLVAIVAGARRGRATKSATA